jgi:hypothetical protein
MWGRKFKGITGNVQIDQNGDRISDYSLLDMDPETGFFEVNKFFHVSRVFNLKKFSYATFSKIVP